MVFAGRYVDWEINHALADDIRALIDYQTAIDRK
jgi:hypothetical protein